jgi:tetratricopeptide (TPR) repeat protein
MDGITARISTEVPMTTVSEPTGSLAVALQHTTRLLESDPVLACEQASEILKTVPDHPVATLLLGIARRTAGDAIAALQALEPLVAAQPNWAQAHHELGITLAVLDRQDAALAALRRAVSLKPDMPDAWREIGDQLTARGDSGGADAAYARHIKASTQDPRLMSAALALCENRIAQAESLLREHLKRFPTDVAAIRMLAEIAGRLGRYQDAENLLARCLELAPSFDGARHNYALALHRQNKSAAALLQVDRLTASEPRNAGFRNLKAVILARIGDYQESIELYADVLAKHPEQSKIWLSYGHALSSAGRRQDSISAYRRCIELAPGFGEAYYSLANLKTFRFSADERERMDAHLAGTDITQSDRAHFHFAVGKALEDDRRFEESFGHYAAANRLRLAKVGYDAAETATHVRRSKALFTKEFFASRAGFGATHADPIFIVGMPRAGSTLIEQMLASHSSVEGTMELPDIMIMAANLGGRRDAGKGDSGESAYPDVLATLSAAQCRQLGDQYIEQTRIQRKTDKPFFTDKMPNNFLHIGLIHLALPNAKIIDARRHPMACCFSGFKQNFAQGQRYTYSLEDIGRYYRDYVELTAHHDAVAPGKIHRVFYEEMIDDTETCVRRLLEFCGLPFEESCLRFYENDRAVRTASAQQVRKPIFRDGVDQWRNYEPWLALLKEALGPVLDAYPDTPPCLETPKY